MTPKYIRNIGKPWTQVDNKQLKDLSKKNTPTRVIGLIMGRPQGGVRAKASELNISLKPINQTPYNKRNK